MPHRYAELAFTPAVRAAQSKEGSRSAYARLEAAGGPNDALGAREAAFLAQADSLYLASVGETGWPYVQHRGGPAGFLCVLSATRIGFADFRGNRQLVSAGNVSVNDRVSIIVVDYFNRQRLKLLGRLSFVEARAADPELLAALASADYPARVERLALIDVAAFDWNCPQHIPLRFSEAQVHARMQPLEARIAELEEALARAAARPGDTAACP